MAHSAAYTSSNYERMSGNCTRLLATEIISTISPPISSTSHILDSACGPGIVSGEIKRLYPNVKITAADISTDMISQLQKHVQTEGWSNIETEVLDGRDLKTFKDCTFTHAIVNLGLLGTDPEGSVKAASELYRVLRVGGVAVLSTWADRVWTTAFLNTARAVRPEFTTRNPFALSPEAMRGSWLMRVLEDGGFGNNVQVRPATTYTSAASMDELVENMLLAKGMFFPDFSEEEMERAKPVLREELRRSRTFEELANGGVRIGMKAWIGIGWKRGDEKEVPC